MSRFRVAMFAAFVAFFVALPAFLGFYAFREFDNTVLDRAEARDFAVMTSGAVSTLKDDTAEVAAGLVSNVGPRAGSLLAYLGDNMQRHQGLSGDVAVLSVQMVIPAKVWPGKHALLDEYGGMSESIIHPALGLPVFDGPNSVLTEGFADFGWLGAIAYSLGVAFIYGLAGAGIVRPRADAGALLIVGAILYSMLSVEKTLAGYLADLRHVVMLFFVYGMALVIYRTLLSMTGSGRGQETAASTSAPSRIHWKSAGK